MNMIRILTLVDWRQASGGWKVLADSLGLEAAA